MALSFQKLSDHGLRAAFGIYVGRVNEIHAMRLGIGHDGRGLIMPGLVTKHHGAQAQGGDLQMAVAQMAILHGVRFEPSGPNGCVGSRADYLSLRRIATKPVIAMNAASTISAHSESVGMAVARGISSFVIVQVTSAPAVSVTLPLELQAPLNVAPYPANASSLTTYVPVASEYEVPGVPVPAAGLPVTSVPESFTCRLKADATATPPLLLMTVLM